MIYGTYVLYANDYFRSLRADLIKCTDDPIYEGRRRKKLKGWQKQAKKRH